MEFYSSYGNQDVVIVNVVIIVTIYYFMNKKNFHPNPTHVKHEYSCFTSTDIYLKL